MLELVAEMTQTAESLQVHRVVLAKLFTGQIK
jgi:hypothetical protein